MATSKGSNIDLNQIRVQLRSSIQSEVKKSIDLVRKALQDNPDDADLYTLLVDAGRENVVWQDEIRNLLQGMSEKGSVLASTALSALNKPIEVPKQVESTDQQSPITPQAPVETDRMNLADDAYYAAEFDKAIQLYEQILFNDPENKRAQQQLNKAKLNRYSKEPSVGIPKEAVSLSRRARSYIAARDFKAAIGLLNEAVGISHEQGVEFSEAKVALNRLQELLDAADYRDQGIEALGNGEWEIAQELFHKARRLDITDQVVIKAEEIVQMLRRAEAFFESYLMSVGSAQDQMARVQPVTDIIATAESLNEIIGVKRFNILQAKHELYKAYTELNNHRMIGLASQKHLVNALSAAQNILPLEDSTKKHAEDVLQKARKERQKLLAIALIGLIIVISITYVAFRSRIPVFPNTLTSTLAIVTVSDTEDESPAPTATYSATATFTPSVTFKFSPSPSPTMSLTSTQQVILETAYITAAYGHFLDAPNGRWAGELTRNQVVIVLEKKIASGAAWYLCKWEKEGIIQEGWILGDFLSFAQPPNPTPLKSPTLPLPSPTPTNTPTLSLNPQRTGFININIMHPQDRPNGRWVAELRRNQIVTIYDSLIVNGDIWYLCRWDTDGEGWILGRYIAFETSTPTP